MPKKASKPKYPRPYVQSRYKHTAEQLDRLHKTIMLGLKDGLLSIADATPISFLTVERGEALDNYDEYQIFIAPEPESGRSKQFNAFALHRRTGQIIVIGRELNRKLALDIALGRA